AKADLDDFHFENVAWLCAFDRDRSGKDVTRHHPFAFCVHLSQLGRNVKLGALRHRIRSAADGVDRHLVTACNHKHRLQRCVEKAPVTGLRTCPQMMALHEWSPAIPQAAALKPPWRLRTRACADAGSSPPRTPRRSPAPLAHRTRGRRFASIAEGRWPRSLS